MGSPMRSVTRSDASLQIDVAPSGTFRITSLLY